MASSGSFKTSSYNGRHLVFAWTEKSQSIEKNTTTISWTLKSAGEAPWTYYYCQNIKVKIAGVTVFKHTMDEDGQIKIGPDTLITSGEYTITHKTDGTKSFTAYAEAGIYSWAVNCTGTKSFTLDTIPRASVLHAEDGVLGEPQSLLIKPASTSFKHRLTYKCGDVAEYIAGSTTTYTTEFDHEWTPRIGLAHEETEKTKVSVTLTLYTYTSDGTHVGTTTKVINCAIPDSVAPSVAIAWEDTTGAADLYNGFPLQDISKLKITLTETTSYSSPIASRVIRLNDVKYTKNPATTGVLTEPGTNTIIAKIQDKRGRAGAASVDLTVLAYAVPSINSLTVRRCQEDGTLDESGEYVVANFTATISPVMNLNTAKYTIRYKATDADTWTEEVIANAEKLYNLWQQYVFPADGSKSFDVEVIAEDNHNKVTRTNRAPTAFTLMNWHPSGTGMGIGKVSEAEDTLEVGLNSYFQAPVYGKVYGLSTLPSVPEGSDLNDYLTPGVYAVRSTEIAETLSNIPIKLSGRLIVAHANGHKERDSNVTYLEHRFIPISYGSATADRPEFVRYVFRENTDTFTYREWFNTALKAYPIGSIYMRYDHTNPADIFGGTWARISNYILRGAAEGGTIGETGTLADGSGRTYINISIWRRTA